MPAEHQIRGLGPITLNVHDLGRTALVLTDVMNMRRVRDHASVDGDAQGGVHHVAFRTPDDAQYEAWAQRLNELGVRNSGAIDRFYFRSLYFREPNGILFEIATDGPGFATDEPMETLGEKLALPPFLEPRRAEIEAGLKPLG